MTTPPRDPHDRVAAAARPDERATGRSAAARRRRAPRLLLGGLLAAVLALATAAALELADAERRVATVPPVAAGDGPSVLLLGSGGEIVASRGGFVGRRLGPDELPPRLVAAVLAIEDRRFFEHPGVDIRGIARALGANLSAGGIREGGSTITQQLAKLDYAGSERSLARKFDELFLAWALERRHGKREILARYLNRIYLGAGVYGVDAAARRYFGTTPDRLTLAQAAMLAGLIRAPSATAPTVHPEAAVARAGQVLDAMVETGAISAAEAAAARAAPAQVAGGAEVGPGINYFADWAAEQAVAGLGDPAQRDLVAQTTVDAALQRIAEAALERGLAAQPAARRVGQGAVVVMAPDGAVRALVGGRDYRASQFNRATRARRQPGSVFKPFVYLAALEAGVTGDTMVMDGPVSIGGWAPENNDGRYAGPVTVEAAFARSINTVAAQLADRVGPERVVGMAQRLGVLSPLRATPSLALGTSEVTLLELMGAYGTIANGGRRVQPYGVVQVQTPDRLVHPLPPVRPEPLLQPAIDDEMLRFMVAAIERGTGRAARLDRPAAGKTGTTQDNRDAWFIGFTRDLVVGVWVGNDDNAPMAGVTGGGLPAQIWRDVMAGAYATGRFGPPSRARPIVGPRPAPSAPPVAQAAPPPAAPRPGFLDGIGRDLGRVADDILSIFR